MPKKRAKTISDAKNPCILDFSYRIAEGPLRVALDQFSA